MPSWPHSSGAQWRAVALLEEWTAAAGAPPAGLIIASPANPTGTVIAPDELAAIARWCDANDVLLVSDEIYHGSDPVDDLAGGAPHRFHVVRVEGERAQLRVGLYRRQLRVRARKSGVPGQVFQVLADLQRPYRSYSTHHRGAIKHG